MRIMHTALFFLIAFALASAAKAESEPLTVICDKWPPYQMMENNHVSGFSTKVIETVFQRMKIDTGTITIYPWKRAMTMLENGAAEAVFSANYTENRTHFAYYPKEAIVQSPWIMWVGTGKGLKFESFDDLIGKRIGLVRGYSYTPELWDFVKKHNNYELVTNDESNFQKLNGGRIDFIPAELGNGLYIVKKLGLKNIRPLMDNPIKVDGLYIIFNKNRVKESLVDKFSSELKKLKQEPLYKELYNNYFDLPGNSLKSD